MLLPRSLVLVLPAILDRAVAANIFVSHFSGNVLTLSLTQSNGAYTLAQNTSLSVGGQPSWITFDSSSRTIYVSDETGWGTASLTALNAATNGGLSVQGKTSATIGSVASGIYGGGKFIANAHYDPSTISNFKLPITSSSTTIQTPIKLTMVGKGPNQSRQSAPHPHAVFPDPTGQFLLAPDLGADQIRIFSINQDTGVLTACPSYNSTRGNGPRHGVFNGDMLYITNELSNSIDALYVLYPATGCMELTKQQTLTTRPGNATLPSGTKVAEVRIKDTSLYVTNRRDGLFSPNDSIAHFEIGCAGNLTFQEITSSGGTYPRTFDINKAGDFLVIGDQTTANVVVVPRNTTSGALGTPVATLRIGATGTPEAENGISAVLWDQ